MAKMTRWTFRYGVSVVAVATAVAFLMIPEIGKGLVSLLYLAVLVGAWYGGLGPGLLATTLTAVIVGLAVAVDPDLAPWRVVASVLFVAGAVLITLLVEALHAARRRVEASQQWLMAVLTSIGDAVIATDAQGRASFLNPVAQALTGWGSEEAVGKSLTEIFRIVSEDTHEPVEDPVTRVLREKTVVGLANHTVLIARDGTERPIEDSGAPIQGKDKEKKGTTLGVVLVFRDVTQRRQTDAVLARLAAIVEASDDAIIGKDLDGIVTSWNAGAERLFGYSAEEMVGRPISLLIPPDRRDEESQIRARLRHGEQVNHFESIRNTKDGQLIDVSMTISPIRDDRGRIVGASKIARDISDRKRLERELRRRLEELAEADRRKDEFLAMLAHELRNPLAAISSAVQLTTLIGAQDQIRRSMDVINRQLKHLSRLIDDLCDVSRITRGKIQLRKERLDVAMVLRSAIESVRPLIETRRHNLTVTIPAQPLLAEADPVRLEQIITNLLTNAAKYTDSGGQIWVSAERDGEEIAIKVRDAGMGIPAEQLPRLFDLFAQGARSLARSEGGLGIGLTLVRSLTEMHGGSVTATSAGPGTGSEFVVRLPAALTLSDACEEPKSQAEPGPRRGSRVLVVDDNVELAQGLANLLKLLNHEVWTAYDGPTGLEAARGHRPEVVLLDIGLPGLDGYQVAEQLRQEEFGKDVLLIAVTGYGQEEDRQQAFSAGFDHFLTKPVDYATLRELMVATGSPAP
jgi:PAS domain S-box-containing protein